MNAPSAYALEAAMAALQRALVDEADPETGELVTIETASENVQDLLARVLRAAVDAEALSDGTKARMADLKARKERFDRRAGTLRGVAFAALDALELRKLELPDLTVSIKQNPPRVVITDEALIPPELTRTTVAPDQPAITAALKAGQTVPGAELSNQLPSIQIRVR